MRTLYFSIATAALLISGCQQADPIIGTWTSSGTMQGMQMSSETVFTGDKKFTQSIDLNVPGGQSLKMNVTGTWAWEEGKKLKTTASDVTVESSNAQLKQMFAQNKQMVLDGFNNTPAQELAWSGNDSFSMTVQGQQVTYNRKK